MPRTLDYLKHLNESGLYEVFEFDLYHVVGWHSDRNTAPLVLGAFDADVRFADLPDEAQPLSIAPKYSVTGQPPTCLMLLPVTNLFLVRHPLYFPE